MKLDFNFSRSSKRVGQAPSPVGQASSLSNLAGPNCRQTTGTAPANALARPTGNPPSFVRRDSLHHSRQSGIALVITLIMLSVTLVMAVSFLAISNRERGSVTTGTDANHARLAAESALAGAEGQIIASMFSTTNPYNFGLLVSTNFTSYHGFVPGLINPTNVNYGYLDNGSPLTAAEMLQNIANLQILPRAPVFVPRNGAYDFRYYLDLNRNGAFDDTGTVTNWQMVNGSLGQNGMVSQIGDPQWIGVLEHPDVPHGPGNRFIGRYCFIAVPVGNTLDVNAIYNDSAWARVGGSKNMQNITDCYERNEGVGSWELNLAAFLADLNTNEWDNLSAPYKYQTPFDSPNKGVAFDDAFSLLSYRYNSSLDYQNNLQQFYNYNNLPSGYVDEFGAGPLMTNNYLPAIPNSSFGTTPWAGSPNTNLFFTPSDFFDPTKTQANLAPGVPGFTDRLLNAETNTYPTTTGGRQVPTYDRYTFYRMLTQLGTDSTPEAGKMNLNFVNVDANGNVVPGMETNFFKWNAAQFFTNAADRLLRAYTTNWFQSNPQAFLATYYGNPGNYSYVVTNAGIAYTILNDPTGKGLTNRPFIGMTNQVPGFGINGIPVFLYGNTFVYSPAVQRLLQLAANMFDATTNSSYPSVFQPLFSRDNSGDVFITGYQYVPSVSPGVDPAGNASDLRLSKPVNAVDYALGGLSAINLNIYGVPWIIGAKPGFPHFNKFGVQNTVQIERNLQILRPTAAPFHNTATNQQYVFNVSSSIGVQYWNSSANAYPNTVDIYVNGLTSMMFTNDYSGLPFPNFTNYPIFNHLQIPNWTGSGLTGLGGNVNPYSFRVALSTNLTLLTNSVFYFGPDVTPGFYPEGTYGWETANTTFPFPRFGLLTTTRLQTFMLDGTHVIDYVQLNGPDGSTNISPLLQNGDTGASFKNMWNTNANGNGVPWGIISQIAVSDSTADSVHLSSYWKSANLDPGEVYSEIDGFATFMGLGQPYPTYSSPQLNKLDGNLLAIQVPYQASAVISQYFSEEANDPLVHYTLPDLNFVGVESSGAVSGVQVITGGLSTPAAPDYFVLNDRYQPWGRSVQMQQAFSTPVDTNASNIAFKDPLVWTSDYWQFPTNQFPSVGWLGRVHRGTPWQTVFLKSTNLLGMVNFRENAAVNGLPTWMIWTGDTGNAYDATNSAPVKDRLLFDLFTTAPNDTATLGQLSINQTHLAAWSAVLSGLPLYTNIAGTNIFAQPAGVNGTNYIVGNPSTYLGYIWNNIQQTRSTTNMFPSQVFGHVGDICAVPALSDASPYLQGLKGVGVNDEMYEWIAQHTLSQLKVGTPRYVIYCYGQALKPAQNGIVGGGTYALMCTNYQIVAETAVRAVVQVENPNSANPTIVIKNVNPLPPDQ